jgi:hypothetical protein
LILTISGISAAPAATVRVMVENMGPAGSTSLTPVFAGFHDGSADLFDAGDFASEGLERLAEDGNTEPLATGYRDAGRTAFTVGGLLGPGASAISGPISIDVGGPDRYLNVASMVVPSNDFFIGNDSATMLDLASLESAAPGSSLVYNLLSVYDAGTEVEDFSTSAANGLFDVLPDGQSGPDQGVAENGVISLVDGSDPFSGFLNRPAGFSPELPGLRVTVTAVPEPAAVGMLLAVAAGLAIATLYRRSRRVSKLHT